MADEGIALDPELVRRSHALHLFVMAGISALPGAEEMSADQLAQRAGIARLSLDLLDATSAA